MVSRTCCPGPFEHTPHGLARSSFRACLHSFVRPFVHSFASSFGHAGVAFAFCAGFSFRVFCCSSFVMLYACNHSASPPGGNQVDGLPPALHLTLISVTINDVFWKHLKIVVPAGVWISLSESFTAGRCESRKLYVTKQPAPWTGNLEIMNFF